MPLQRFVIWYLCHAGGNDLDLFVKQTGIKTEEYQGYFIFIFIFFHKYTGADTHTHSFNINNPDGFPPLSKLITL